MNILHFSVS